MVYSNASTGIEPAEGFPSRLPTFSRKNLLRLGTIRTICFVVEAGLAFFIMPFIIHTLGNEMYGLWALIGTFLAYFSLLDLGVSSGVQRFVSRALGMGRMDEVNTVVNTSLVIFIFAGLTVIGVSAGAAMCVELFTKDIALRYTCQAIIVLMGSSIGAAFPFRVFEGTLSSLMRHDLVSLVRSSWFIIQSCLIVLLLKAGYGILAMALIASGTMLAQYITQMFLVKRICRDLKVRLSLFRKEMVGELFGYGLYGFLTQVASLLRLRVGNIIIAAFLGLSGVTFYAVAMRFLDYFDMLLASAMGFSTPLFSQYEGAGDMGGLRNRFLEFTEASIMVSAFIGSSLIFYGLPFITRWLGSGFETSYYLLAVMTIPVAVVVMLGSNTRVLFGISKHRFFSFVAIGEGAVAACGSVLMVKILGIYGVAIGIGIPILIARLVIVPPYVCKQIQLDLTLFYHRIVISTLKALVPCIVYFLLIRQFLTPSYSCLAIAVLGQMGVFLVCAVFLFLNNEKRGKLRDWVYSLWPFVKIRKSA